MKLLPCSTCRDHATLPSGKPYFIGRAPEWGTLPYRFYCARCKRSNHLTSEQFAQLPSVTMAQLRVHAHEHLMLQDLKGAGLSDDQVGQLEDAGILDEALDGTHTLVTR